MNLYAVILCGGKGERFWPKSRLNLPKQFGTIFGRHSLTKVTSNRIRKLCPLSRQLFVAPVRFAPLLQREFRVKSANLLLEPEGRNTAPAIGLAAVILQRRDPEAIMAVLPADHIIAPESEFLKAMRLATAVAQKGMLVTFGIIPTRADTGYGYIHSGEQIIARGKLSAHLVRAFKEKPNRATAQRYIESGEYLWNSGMFVWRVDVILAAFQHLMPEFYQQLMAFRSVTGTGRQEAMIKKIYARVPAISIDYAIMEKAENVAVIRSGFQWDDVGSWLALERRLPRDKLGNVHSGLWFGRGTRNCIIYSDNGVIATLGTNDLIIAWSGDAVLIAHKSALGELKQLLADMAQDPNGRKFL
jgi:mannose-1-phosphate guanylyltransferase